MLRLPLEDTSDPDLSNCSVTDGAIECSGTDNQTLANDWNAANIAALESCVADTCDTNFTGQITSDYDFNNLSSTCGQGGTIAVVYTITDDCGNDTTLNATLTLEDTSDPDLSNCSVTDGAIECSGTDNETLANDWNAANIAALESCVADTCDTDFTGQITSDYDFNNLSSTCGQGGTIAVVYTITDDCGNDTTLNATLTLEDTSDPDLSNCSVTDGAIECSGTDNETLANDWNAANIAALESCVADTCDTDFTGQITSDYDFNNLSSTCGQGGTIAVVYTITDDCGNATTLNATLTLEDTSDPDLSNCSVTDGAIECSGTDNQTLANDWNAANIAALESCVADTCDTNFTGQITSDYDFNNLSSTCGQGGTIAVVYTITDDCGNDTTLNATLTLEDTSDPDLSNCSVTDGAIECSGTDNETLANDWNAANIAALESCVADTCDTDFTGQITSDYDFNNLSSTCGQGGTIAVVYTITDDCGNATTLNATLTLEDTSDPDLSNCSVTDGAIECSGTDNETLANDWNAANIAALESCVADTCDTDFTGQITSDYDFNNLSSTCGQGGTIAVVYTITDDCGNDTTLNATLTLEDTSDPDLSNCSVTDGAIECSGTDNETLANDWNAANIAALESCVADTCDTDFTGQITSDYDFNNLSSTCGQGGTIAVVYTITDDCGNATTLNATLTLEDTSDPDLSNCSVTDGAIECSGTDNETLANDWNAANIAALESCVADTCDTNFTGQITSDYDFNNLSSTCGQGGTIAVVYTITDDCGNATTLNATLTLEDTSDPDLSNCSVTDGAIECSGTDNETLANDWNAANIAALESCVADTCDTDFTGQITSDYDFNNLSSTCGQGGTIAVVYTITDDCGNDTTLNATLTLEDTSDPDLSNCSVTDGAIECSGTDNETLANDWNAANIAALESCVADTCDTDFTGQITSDYDFNNLSSTCGQGGTIAVVYTITDDCGNATTLNATLTLEDTSDPDLSNCSVENTVLECSDTENESLADAWNAANIAALESCVADTCDTDFTGQVTSNYDFNNLNTTCGPCGTINVVYTITDDCGNSSSITVTLTFDDGTIPDLSNCSVTDGAIECYGTDNETLANDWNAANIAALESCADDLGVTVTSDYDFNNLSSTCGQGGTIAVVYTITDDCGNATTLNATLTLEDTSDPDLSNCSVTDGAIECSGTDNETLANDWNAANIAALESCVADTCDTDFTGQITSDYDFNNLSSTCGQGGTIAVVYTITDDCGNDTTLNATLTLEDTSDPDLSNCSVTDGAIECSGTDNEIILANDWNAANIAALESCVADTCDTDFTGQITSDYDFNNLSSTCGQGGTIAVVYTITDDCGNATTLNATLTLEDTSDPDLSNCSVTDGAIECSGTDNETLANDWNAANIAALESCVADTCDTDFTGQITSDYDFNNLSSTCGQGGTIAVVYTITDDCGNATTLNATLTLEDTSDPDLSNCSVENTVLECSDTENESLADAWNAANIAALESCVADTCDTDFIGQVTSDYDFNNLNTTCGPCGTINVVYTITDDCGNATTLNATLTFDDGTIPDLSNCSVTDGAIECSGTDNQTLANDWNAANITALESCADDIAVTVTSDYDFNNLSSTCGQGGTIAVVYTITDDCGNATTLNATLTLEDTSDPDLSNCSVTDGAIECSGTDNETLANDWNAANIAALESCVADTCDTDFTGQITSDYDFNNLSSTCGQGGTIAVVYTITDDCGNDTTLNATLTLEDTSDPDLSNCSVTDGAIECSGTDNETLANDWNAANIAALESCVADTCDTDFTGQITSDYDFNNLSSTCGQGGTIAVVYTITDDCGNDTTLNATLTLEDTSDPDLSNCSVENTVLECSDTENESLADAWNAANIAALESCVADTCDTDFTGQVTSNYDFNNLNTTCGPCGTINVVYTITDDCGNATTLNATLTFDDGTIPDLSNCSVTDQAIECSGTDNETLANDWNAANIAALESCADDLGVTVTSDYDFNNLSSTCGQGGTIAVVYTITDDCGNATTLNATLTLEDTSDPDLSNCSVTDGAIECSGTDNETLANDWNAANIAALESCVADTCDTNFTGQVTSDYDFNNLSSTCGQGGTIAVVYTITDDCGNATTLNATLTLEDTSDPDLSNCSVTDGAIECSGTDNETLANDWNAANIAALESCVADTCDTDFTGQITSDYDFNNLSSTCGQGGTIAVVYTITDDCGNDTTLNATLTLEDTSDPDLSNCSVTDGAIECSGTDNETLANDWNAANIAALESCVADTCDTDFTGQITSDYDFNNLSSTCGQGGTIAVVYTITDDCGNDTTLNATLTLEDTSDPDLSNCSVTDGAIECSGTDNQTLANDWNAANIAALESCVADTCDTDFTGQITSDYDFNNLSSTCGQGGTIAVVYTITDDCGNATTLNATLTLEDTSDPIIDIDATNLLIECDINGSNTAIQDWLDSNGGAVVIDDCSSSVVTWTNNYSGDVSDCSTPIEVMFTATDDCGNSVSTTATYAVQDTVAPVITNAAENVNVHCDGTGNNIDLQNWLANNGGTTATDDCSTITWTNNYTALSDGCGATGFADVTFTAMDACGNETSSTATFSIIDTTAPDLTNCPVMDDVIECEGTDNNIILANDWNAANIAALESCATDSCDADLTGQVTSNYDFNNLVSTCGQGGTIDVQYLIIDDCGNQITVNALLTIEDTTAPVLTSDLQDIVVTCDDIPGIPDLIFEDACSAMTVDAPDPNNEVIVDIDPDNYQIIRTWTVTDECMNFNTYTQIINVGVVNQVNATDTELCIEDDFNFDLFDTLSGNFDTNGIWTVTVGDATLDGSFFNPTTLLDINGEFTDADLGDYMFTYTVGGICPSITDVIITINDDCVVLPCGEEDLIISKAVTPSIIDGENDVFSITGIEDCGFIIELQIFNRWGAKIYDNSNYQNNWNGQASGGSIGNSGFVPTGTYYYIIKLNNSGLRPITGPIYVSTN